MSPGTTLKEALIGASLTRTWPARTADVASDRDLNCRVVHSQASTRTGSSHPESRDRSRQVDGVEDVAGFPSGVHCEDRNADVYSRDA